MKSDKDFKKEFNQGFANASYAGRKLIIWGIIIILICAIGGFGYRYVSTNVDRVIFKQSITYNEGKLDDLAKYQLEMSQTKDPEEKAAIQEYVNSVYSNFDESKIENQSLKQFLVDCRNGEYNVD